MCLKSDSLMFIRNLCNIFPYFTPSDPKGFIDKWCDELIKYPIESLENCLFEIQNSHRKFFPSLPEIIQICKKHSPLPSPINFDYVNQIELLKTKASQGLFDPSEWESHIKLLNESGRFNCADSVEKRLIYWKKHFEVFNNQSDD